MEFLDRYLRDEVDLWEVVAHYQSGGNLSELVRLMHDPEHVTEALCIASEIGSKAREIGGDVVPFVADSLPENAYWALSYFHSLAKELCPSLVVRAVLNSNLCNEAIFAKTFSILMMQTQSRLDIMLQSALASKADNYHVLGLFLHSSFISHYSLNIDGLLKINNKVLNLYVFSMIGRVHREDGELRSTLPKMVEEELRFIERYPS